MKKEISPDNSRKHCTAFVYPLVNLKYGWLRSPFGSSTTQGAPSGCLQHRCYFNSMYECKRVRHRTNLYLTTLTPPPVAPRVRSQRAEQGERNHDRAATAGTAIKVSFGGAAQQRQRELES
eukprot:TRINITY_DN79073_c0_g1_i1.p1 TRINITY_DN79073_c0_g1~~TRINITY_DN79073_c0_g1_i1.p1  ORF type:complete len:121 (+),score=2.44 TRINITY_DN79073_c0_g1_i1:101-463(+)